MRLDAAEEPRTARRHHEKGCPVNPVRVAKTILLVAVTVAATALVAACSSAPEGSTDPGQLDGAWKLASYRDAAGEVVETDPAIESQLTLDAGASSGVGGVNTFSGEYEAGDDGSISFGPQASTLMAGPDNVMAQEDGLYRALADAASFGIAENTLTLSDADGEELATFTRLGQ